MSDLSFDKHESDLSFDKRSLKCQWEVEQQGMSWKVYVTTPVRNKQYVMQLEGRGEESRDLQTYGHMER